MRERECWSGVVEEKVVQHVGPPCDRAAQKTLLESGSCAVGVNSNQLGRSHCLETNMKLYKMVREEHLKVSWDLNDCKEEIAQHKR
jgi:hypothetical protein